MIIWTSSKAYKRISSTRIKSNDDDVGPEGPFYTAQILYRPESIYATGSIFFQSLQQLTFLNIFLIFY